MTMQHTSTSEPKIPPMEPLEISPALESLPQVPLSTYWMPLDELTHHWAEMSQMLTLAPVVPVLAAIGHAFLSLAKETRALRVYTLAWQDLWGAPRAETTSRFNEARHLLDEAASHWSWAAIALENLSPTDLDTVALQTSQRLSWVAHTQQERLGKLADEVGIDIQTWRGRQRHKQEGH